MGLPFTVSSVHWGLSLAQGTVALEPEYLVFRVQVRVLGLFDQAPYTVKVAPEVLREVRLKRALVGRDTLVVRPNAPDLLAEMPGRHESVLELKVERRYRREAAALVERVRAWAHLDLYA